MLYELRKGVELGGDILSYDTILLSPRFLLINWGEGGPNKELKRKYLLTMPLPAVVLAKLIPEAKNRGYAVSAITDQGACPNVKTKVLFNRGGCSLILCFDGTVCIEQNNEKDTCDELLSALGHLLEATVKEAITIP